MVTTIQIDEKLKEKLDKLKVHYRESYNDLITRILSSCNPKMVSKDSLIETIETLSDPEEMREIAEALDNYEKHGGKTLEQVEKELKLNV